MLQLFVAVVLTILAVMFAMANTHHVELNFVLGEPVEIRLIFLLVATYFAGGSTAYLYLLFSRVTRGFQRRRERLGEKRRVVEGEFE